MRAVSMGDGSFNNAMELIHKQSEDLTTRQQPVINGVNSNHAGKSIRGDERDHERNQLYSN